MGKHDEYREQTQVMNRIRTTREDRNLHANDMARIVSEATGYHFTPNMYDACEKGITKNVPLWAIIALLASEELAMQSADEFFGDILYRW